MKKKFYLLALLHSMLFSTLNRDFKNLQHYILTLPENVISEKKDWESPIFDEFYKTFAPSWTEQTLRFLNLKKDNPWSINTIEELLERTVENRKRFIEKGDYVTHLTTKANTKFIIWGDLFGAVHSLLRTLQDLNRQGILDNELRIIKPDYYFVFLGNVIGRSPYSLEILHIILLLMERNPDRLFYIKGKHETNNHWYNFTLKYQLENYFGGRILYEANVAKLEQLITDFFNSLSGALYITQKDSTNNVICLSNYIENYALGSNYFERFFSRDIGSIEHIAVTRNKTSQEYNIVALIKGGNEVHTPLASNGLTLLEPYKYATVWSVFSCPSLIYQRYFNIYNDACVELTIGKNLMRATLQLFYQDVRNREGFNKGKLFNAATGGLAYDANKEASYFVGSSMPLTKGLPEMGQDIKNSMFNLINDWNLDNYLNNRFIQVTILDDEYKPNLALKNIEKLINDYKIDTILLPVGSPTLSAYLNLVKEGKISVLFPATGNPGFRKEDLKNIIHWRASYAEEARVLVNYMLNENAVKKFAFFYQNDSYGLGPLEAAHALLKEKGITDWIDIPYNKTGLNFDEAAAALAKAQPDAIGLFSIPSSTKEFFRKVGIEQLINKKIFGISFIADDSFRSFAIEQGLKIVLAQVVPNPRTSNLEIAKEFRSFMDKHNLSYNVYSLESYICTSLYLEALKSVKDIATRKQILAYFEAFKAFQYKGLTMTFNPKTRDLGQSVWLEIDENNWKEYKIKE